MPDRDPINEAIAHGIRDYCASVEVKTKGRETPDPMFFAPQYAASIRKALAAGGYEWQPVSKRPPTEEAYLVYMPDRDLDRYSVQYWSDVDGWSSDLGITHWKRLEPPA